jgi:hypothetical protein
VNAVSQPQSRWQTQAVCASRNRMSKTHVENANRNQSQAEKEVLAGVGRGSCRRRVIGSEFEGREMTCVRVKVLKHVLVQKL